MGNNTLIIAFTSFAGMGPYVSTIINSFKASDPVYFFLLDKQDKYFKNNIKPELKSKSRIITIQYSILDELKNLLFSNYKLGREITDYIKENNICNIHLLTSATLIRGKIDQWKKNYNILMTVHDLHPHEAKKAFHKEWKQKLLYQYQDTLIKKIDYLMTNSKIQYDQLYKKFPKKGKYYHDFPTLITSTIEKGALTIPELNGVTNYILFFGRLEYYKGLHILYDAWIKDKWLQDNYTLVIAGSGDNYINRTRDEKNIIFVNRYIKDEEIKSLYKNALISVYPYISATQSGVLSLSCYFQIPVLTSDIPFFRNISEEGIGLTFKNNDVDDLAAKLIYMLKNDLSNYRLTETKYYKDHFHQERIRERLLSIYSEVHNYKN